MRSPWAPGLSPEAPEAARRLALLVLSSLLSLRRSAPLLFRVTVITAGSLPPWRESLCRSPGRTGSRDGPGGWRPSVQVGRTCGNVSSSSAGRRGVSGQNPLLASPAFGWERRLLGEPGAWRGAQGPGEVIQSRVASSVAPVGPTHPRDTASPAWWSKRVEAKMLAPPSAPGSEGPCGQLLCHSWVPTQPSSSSRGCRPEVPGQMGCTQVGGFPLPPQECWARPRGGRHGDLTWPHLPTPLHGSNWGAGGPAPPQCLWAPAGLLFLLPFGAGACRGAS